MGELYQCDWRSVANKPAYKSTSTWALTSGIIRATDSEGREREVEIEKGSLIDNRDRRIAECVDNPIELLQSVEFNTLYFMLQQATTSPW